MVRLALELDPLAAAEYRHVRRFRDRSPAASADLDREAVRQAREVQDECLKILGGFMTATQIEALTTGPIDGAAARREHAKAWGASA